MKTLLVRIFISCFLVLSFQGQTSAQDQTKAGEVKILSSNELKVAPRSYELFIYLDELSLMGDVGEGGGVVKKWLHRLKRKIARRMRHSNPETNNTQELRGKRFIFNRARIPNEVFSKLELASIVEFRTKSNGSIKKSGLYSYHLRTEPEAQEIESMHNLVAIETLDGTVIFAEEIIGVTFEF